MIIYCDGDDCGNTITKGTEVLCEDCQQCREQAIRSEERARIIAAVRKIVFPEVATPAMEEVLRAINNK